MKNEKDYIKLKKNFIKVNGLSSDNIYNYLSVEQVNIIRNYYEVYTKYLFNKIMGGLRLEVSPSKAKKLVELKGAGSWEFAGMVDSMKRGGACCELGHPLRYVYSARNTENNKLLHFGIHCVGDFFDIDEKGVNALSKVKDVMFSELKDIVSIKEQNLFNEHYKYDCEELGLIYSSFGIEGVKKLLDLNSLMPLVVEFLSVGLPLPESLLEELKVTKSSLTSLLDSSEFIGLDDLKIKALKNSKLTMVSNMFSNSEQYVKKSIKNIDSTKCESDFFNFNNVNDLNVAASIWVNREDRLNKVYSYFEKQNVSNDWVRIYRYMVDKGYKRDLPNLYFAVEILILFSPNITINQSFNTPKIYSYKGFELKSKVQENFDNLIDYMATRECIMSLKELTSLLNQEDEERERDKKEKEEMMNYLKDNLLNDKYKYVRGVNGVIDIVNVKKLDYFNMTSKQQSFVVSVYNAMKSLDTPKVDDSVSVEDREINNRYKLVEKPDVLAKIQRLQNEAGNELSEKLLGIIHSIMTYKQVSDKQMNRINEAYSMYILKETTVDSRENKIEKTVENKKWNLIEREDVKNMILKIQSLPDYMSIPSGVRNIFENILKYNSVSDNQIRTVERTYNRYFRGR